MAAVKSSLALLIISALSALFLSGVHTITRAPIEQQRLMYENAAIAEILPGVTETRQMEAGAGIVTGAVSGYNAGGVLIGYVVSASARGYSGPVGIIAGFDTRGTLTGVRVVMQSETPGLGSLIQEPVFLSQFEGLSGPFQVTRARGGSRPDEIETLASATISTNAVVIGVNAAIEYINEHISRGP